MTLEYKTLALKAKPSGTTVSADASTFNGPPDSYGDVILPGAFAKDISERGNIRPAFWQHNSAELLGMATVKETSSALRVTFSLVPEVRRASEALALAAALGPLLGVSIGYEDQRSKVKAGVRYIEQIKLYEVSFVSLAANPDARVDITEDDVRLLAEHLEHLTTKTAIDAAFQSCFLALKGQRQ